MHGKSGCFALQKSRFRNAKTKLPFFFEIIFTKLRVFSSYLLELLGESRRTRNPMRTSFYLAAKGATPHALNIGTANLIHKKKARSTNKSTPCLLMFDSFNQYDYKLPLLAFSIIFFDAYI